MSIVLVGMNHKTSPVEIRECFSIQGEEIKGALTRLLAVPEIEEGMILSTCNRVEILLSGSQAQPCTEAARYLLKNEGTVDPGLLEKALYAYEDDEAVRHLFQVASSLDSMVVGEPQILGQVKDAYYQASEWNACGPMLHKLLHQTFRVAKRVRTETEIAKNVVSISHAAVNLAKHIFESFSDKTVFLLGAGEMVELAARHLLQQGAKDILISNRTHSRAVELAEEFGGEAIPFENFRKRLIEADIVLSCTGAPEPLIDVVDAKGILKLRKYRPMFFIDIAVPRDVDPRVNELENAYLYDLDDLQSFVDANMALRKEEMIKADRIIDREVTQFCAWSQAMQVTPTIKAIREMADEIRRREVEKTFKRLGEDLGEPERQALEKMTQAIVNKLLHDPVTQLKREGGVDGKKTFIEITRKLFGLDTGD